MKKIYQIPEIEIVNSTSSYTIMDGTNAILDDPMANENKNFDENEMSVDASSSLWDD